jgi:hypothetical protein
MRALSISAALVYCLAGCHSLDRLGSAAPGTLDMPVLFEVQSDAAQAVQGARISSRGRTLGISDRDGKLSASLRGAAGENVSLELSCPAGYRASEARQAIVIRAFVPLARGKVAGLRVPVVCEPTERKIALVVRAETQAGMPVLARGREVARTDANGVAHVQLSAQAGEELAVVLSTAEDARLRPQNPRRQFRVSGRDEVFLMTEKFTRKEPPRPRRQRAKHEPARQLPYAL